MAQAALRCVHLSLRLDGVRDAVRDLDLELARGECVALLGPTGSGKSALVALITGELVPTRGSVEIADRPLARTPPHRRGLGVVAAAPVLFPHLDVAGNVGFPLVIASTARRERQARVAAMLEMLGLARLAKASPASLGALDALRVALARALVTNPPLLLLDDPAAGLNADSQAAWLDDLRRVRRALGVAVLLVTRDPTQALGLADRVGVLQRGVLRQIGPPQEIHDRPDSAHVAACAGAVNLLAGRIEGRAGDIAYVRLRAGPVVSALAVGELGGGDPCLFAIRPDRIALAIAEAARMGESAIAAVVEDTQYQGARLRLRLTIGEDAELIADRPAASGAGLVPNRAVALAWPAEQAWAFPLDPAVG